MRQQQTKWTIGTLREHITQLSERNKAKHALRVYSVTNTKGFVLSEEFFSKEVYSANLNNYKVVQRNTFAYNPSRINVGSIDFFKQEKQGLVSPLYVVFKTDDNLSNAYLKHYLKSDYGQLSIAAITQGSVRSNVTFSDLGKIKIPLPPLDIQHHIATLLDQVAQLREYCREAIGQLDVLLESVFVEMFGDPVSNPMGWRKERLGKIIAGIETGNSVNGEMRAKNEDELGVLKVSAVTSGRFKAEEYKTVKKGNDKLPAHLFFLKKGDLLMTRANTQDLVGAVCMVDKDYPDLFLPDKIWRMQLDNSLVLPSYFKFVLSNRNYRRKLSKVAMGSSGSMYNISQEKLLQIDGFPVADYMLQTKFAEIVAETDVLREQLSIQLAEAEALFQSLLHNAFTGELSINATLAEQLRAAQIQSDLLKEKETAELAQHLITPPNNTTMPVVSIANEDDFKASLQTHFGDRYFTAADIDASLSNKADYQTVRRLIFELLSPSAKGKAFLTQVFYKDESADKDLRQDNSCVKLQLAKS